MAEASGTTENEINEPTPRYIHINTIIDEWYDEEMDTYITDFFTYSGDQYSLRLKTKDIERLVLFMRKEQADKKYMKHIINHH